MNDQAPLAVQAGDLPDLYRSGQAKRRRARRNRILSYLAGIVVAAWIAATGDWATIRAKYFDLGDMREAFPDVVTIGVKNTVIYTLGAFLGGVVIGVAMMLLKRSEIRPYRWFATTYIEIFRGLPALLTILIVVFLTPIALGWQFPVVLGVDSGGTIALALVAGAYLAETLRAGIEGVPRGQVEAARSLGMTQATTTRVIVMPQAFRLVIPPLTNELVLLLKDTSLLAFVGTTTTTVELTQFGRNAFNDDFNGSVMILAGIMYLIITIPLTQLVAHLERRNKARR
ncbi:MAG: amino acid ABC transporter permease [Acidimicrobiales bacterium]|nr:amino acid ABC transporter permease [Acidimicrobiales bacterium]HRW37137.1 amino acid ABC transporter permease [Aquihabitans sp.]